MRRRMVLTVLCVLPLGFVAGGVTVYTWLERHGDSHLAEAGRIAGDHGGQAAAHADDHGDHDDHGDAHVELTPESRQAFGVQVIEASAGRLRRTLKLPGEIVLNADRVAHIVPRVAGIVREVRRSVGDKVESGEVLAVLESRELAEARAADLAAEGRFRLAEGNLLRVQELLARKIAPEQEYHEARQKLDEARINHREAAAKLRALGIEHDQAHSMPAEYESDFSHYEIRAPFAGTIIDKHITLGEVHDSDSDVFVLADLSTVWVDISIYAQDFGLVRPGAEVRVTVDTAARGEAEAEGKLFYVSPIVRETTRTGLARAAIDNQAGAWRPGTFVTAEIILGQDEAPVLVPAEAIQNIANQTVVFVEDEPGCFQKRPVEVGRVNGSSAEILSGLKAGERYVAKGAFILKAELTKGAGGHEH